MTDENRIFALNLHRSMLDAGLTIGELSEKIMIDQALMLDYLSAQTLPGASELLKLSGALGVSIDYLLGNEAVQNAAPADGAAKKGSTDSTENADVPEAESALKKGSAEKQKTKPTAQDIAAIFFSRPPLNVIDPSSAGELIVLREKVDLESHDVKGALGGRWKKKSARMDSAVKARYPGARIYMLVAKPLGEAEKKGEKKNFYLVNLPDIQFIVTVSDEYMESRQTPERIDLMRFRLGGYELTNVGLVY